MKTNQSQKRIIALDKLAITKQGAWSDAQRSAYEKSIREPSQSNYRAAMKLLRPKKR